MPWKWLQKCADAGRRVGRPEDDMDEAVQVKDVNNGLEKMC